MYKSTYLAVRVHTEDEALTIDPCGDTDTFLWLIDVYDLGPSDKCALAVKKLILNHYLELHERVPGMLPRWTKGMMTWVTYLNALQPSFEHDEEWVVRNNFMIKKDPETWTVEDMLTTLDAMAMRWKTAHLLERKPLNDYLRCIWSCAKKWTLKLHPNIPGGLKEGDMMKIHPKQIMACLSRFFWFHKTLEMHDMYERKDLSAPCGSFFRDELRHFILRNAIVTVCFTLVNHAKLAKTLEHDRYDALSHCVEVFGMVTLEADKVLDEVDLVVVLKIRLNDFHVDSILVVLANVFRFVVQHSSLHPLKQAHWVAFVQCRVR